MPQTEHLPLFPLLLLVLIADTADVKTTASLYVAAAGRGPFPTPWPEQFHAMLLTNRTGSGGRLELIDVYYDWPRGRTLNVVRGQLSGDPVYNVEWVNGSSYLFDNAASSSCTASWHPVGILPPDWVDGAAYLGRDAVDGFDCHVWSHPFFVRYCEDVATGRPVFWDFFGARRHVLSFKVGGVPQENSPKWQAPASCFSGGDADAPDGATSADVVKIRFAGAAASFDQ